MFITEFDYHEFRQVVRFNGDDYINFVTNKVHDMYSKTPIYRASRGKGFRPGISGGPVNRIVKYTYLHINPVFGGRGKVPVNRGTRYIGAR